MYQESDYMPSTFRAQPPASPYHKDGVSVLADDIRLSDCGILLIQHKRNLDSIGDFDVVACFPTTWAVFRATKENDQEEDN